MKTLGIIALMAMLMAVSVLGVTAPTYVDVHGTVMEEDGFTPAGEGILVTVVCDHIGTNTTKTDDTDIQSEYAVEFTNAECTLGDWVSASVPGDVESDQVTSDHLQLPDLYVLNIELNVPEFSAIAAGVAFAGAGLGYAFMRKRR